MTYRFATLTPWYHAQRSRCEAINVSNELQCINSAKYEGSKTGKGKGVRLCKTHADMADFPMRLIVRQQILIRDES